METSVDDTTYSIDFMENGNARAAQMVPYSDKEIPKAVAQRKRDCSCLPVPAPRHGETFGNCDVRQFVPVGRRNGDGQEERKQACEKTCSKGWRARTQEDSPTCTEPDAARLRGSAGAKPEGRVMSSTPERAKAVR
jgi:hypothetical protein